MLAMIVLSIAMDLADNKNGADGIDRPRRALATVTPHRSLFCIGKPPSKTCLLKPSSAVELE
jgi:hypothetical protein